MSEVLKRLISGFIYVLVLWIATSYSRTSFTLLFIILGGVCFYEMLKLRKGKSKLLPILFIAIPFFIVQLFVFNNSFYSNTNFDPSPILVLFILTWVFDTFAYIIGSNLGRHKIISRISPKKSWEGFVGGMAFTLLSVYFIKQFFDIFSINFLLLLAFVIPFTATLGDLIESFFKREAGVKDSGNLIPGHGGFLDRMDALMISIPALYILLNIFK